MSLIGGNNGGGRQVQAINPGPLPTNLLIGQGQGMIPDANGNPVLQMFLVIGFQTPQGTNTFFLLPSDEMEANLTKLLKIHQLTKAGLTYSEGM